MHHMLMLNNTVHTDFGQKLCMMDNPETAEAHSTQLSTVTSEFFPIKYF